jgi:AcrR family transcriptional regulator
MAARAKARKEAAIDLLEIAFGLVAEVGWRRFSLVEVARRADVPLSEVYTVLPSREHLLRALGERLDRHMLDVRPEELAELSPRERVFELVMRRFDAMTPFKDGLRTIGREAAFDPSVLLVSFFNLDRAAAWLLEASEAGLSGLRARAARRVVMAIYVRVFNVWLDDTTTDLARTLAELDKRLQQAELVARRLMPRAELPPAAATAA